MSAGWMVSSLQGDAFIMRQRLACTLIGASLALVCGLVALLLSDALAPGRLPPMLGFWGACAAGGLLILGLVLLERRDAAPRQHRRAPVAAAHSGSSG
jgi:hypothetical protein